MTTDSNGDDLDGTQTTPHGQGRTDQSNIATPSRRSVLKTVAGTGIGLGIGIGAFAGVSSAHEVTRVVFRECTEVTIYGELLMGSGKPSGATGDGGYRAVLSCDGELVRRPLDGTQRRQHYSLFTDPNYDHENCKVVAIEGETYHPSHQGMEFRICNEHCEEDCAADALARQDDEWCLDPADIPSGGGQGGVDRHADIIVECLTGCPKSGENVITEPTTITESGDYYIGADIWSEDTCLSVSAADVTIHGCGYALLGKGNGVGIRGEHGLKVRNLTIHGFEYGISSVPGSDAHYEGVTVEENSHHGVRTDSYTEATFTDCTIRGNGSVGVYTSDYADLTFADCEVRGNGGPAVSPGTTTPVRVRNCLVADNGGGVNIALKPNDVETEIIDSVIRNNADSGIRTDGTDVMGSQGPVPIYNCEIRDNDGPGIVQFYGFLDIRNCTLAGNRDGYRGLDDPEGFEATLRHNNIEENEVFGVIVEDRPEGGRDVSVDAVCNYWGHESGPTHPDNPVDDPQGQPVSDHVDFRPWSVDRIENGTGECLGGTANLRIDLLPEELRRFS